MTFTRMLVWCVVLPTCLTAEAQFGDVIGPRSAPPPPPPMPGQPYQLAPAGPSTEDYVKDDTGWCLSGAADRPIFQQPSDKAYCFAAQTGAAIAGVYNPRIAAAVGSYVQYQWVREAARGACNPTDINGQQGALFAVMACQCHNAGAVNRMKNNPAAVFKVLRRYVRESSNYPCPEW